MTAGAEHDLNLCFGAQFLADLAGKIQFFCQSVKQTPTKSAQRL
jgi:hypothetical protein